MKGKGAKQEERRERGDIHEQAPNHFIMDLITEKPTRGKRKGTRQEKQRGLDS